MYAVNFNIKHYLFIIIDTDVYVTNQWLAKLVVVEPFSIAEHIARNIIHVKHKLK